MLNLQSIIFTMFSFVAIKSYNLGLNKRTKQLEQIRMVSSDTKQLVFLGTPSIAANVLTKLYKSLLPNNWNIAAVVTQPPSLNGKKKSIQRSPVHEAADSLSIPVYCPEKASDISFLEALENIKPDLCITAAYGNYLPKRFLEIPKFGTVNIHPSLLPLYRGAAPVQRCLERGDDKIGVTILTTVSKMDAGPLLSQTEFGLNGDEKATELLSELFEIGTEKLIHNILPNLFDGTVTRTEQIDSMATFAQKLVASEAKVDFAKDSAVTVHNKVRGFSEWPGVWTSFNIEDPSCTTIESIRVKLITTRLLENKLCTMPSSNSDRVVLFLKHSVYGHCLKVQCHDGSTLAILELQPTSKKVMKARDFVNGLRGNKLVWVSPPEDDNF